MEAEVIAEAAPAVEATVEAPVEVAETPIAEAAVAEVSVIADATETPAE